ncbi:MAG: sugar phosphate isomerase/epimerase family protein [Planctomycetota bacterium]
MSGIQGPAIFLAQFMADEAPFHSFDAICAWAAGLGYRGVQVPSWDARCIDLDQAATSQAYCDDLRATAAKHGLVITELSAHLQGQLVASHSAYDQLFDGFAPEAVRGQPAARQAWAVEQVTKALTASQRLGLTALPSFTGALMWHLVYPWPQRPAGLVAAGFAELARRWRPILDHADSCGVDLAWEAHPGEDVHDGASWERFLAALDDHPRAGLLYDPSHFVLQGMDEVAFIDLYHDRIRAFHVKDAEFRPDGRSGVYGGYQDWAERAGRFRSLGDGQVDFGAVFTRLTHHGYRGWAVVEWECCYKDAAQGAAEGAPFVARHLITPPARAFDDFAGGSINEAQLRATLGLGEN